MLVILLSAKYKTALKVTSYYWHSDFEDIPLWWNNSHETKCSEELSVTI